MVKRNIIWLFLALAGLFVGCQEEEPNLENLVNPGELTINSDVASDRSGNVTVTPSASGALYFHVYFTQGGDPVVLTPGGSASFRFTRSGEYQAPVTVVAYGAGGLSSSTTVLLDMDVRLFIDAETLQQIAGDGEKRWVWDQTVGGHFGVGPLTNNFPEFFSAAPNSLNSCLYDDVLIFSHDGNDNYTFTLDPGATSETFINWTEVNRFFPDATPAQFIDECRDITDQASFTDNFVILDNGDGTRSLDVGASFLSYWAVISGEYEILSFSENELYVRGASQPFNGDDPLFWYYRFVPEDAGSGGAEEFEPVFENLVFEDDFDTDGAPDPSVWTYDLGTGNNGWGNSELQYYTDRPENVVVEDGVLKINALRETFEGAPFTSARIKTQGLYEFTYGRVEIRAKLPTGGGTWPALWMLGADFETNPWPAAGEIDIMEHVGNNQDVILGSTHDPNNFGGNARTVSTSVPGVSEEFNTYTVIWTEERIEFFVNNESFGSFVNNETLPFNKDFFLIVNVAMGGNLGGDVDSQFSASSMEVDYVRVYQ